MLTDSQYNQLIALLQEVLSELNEKERTKEKEKNIVVVQDNTTDNMTTDEQQQRHNTILEVALYYLSNGWSNAYMEAQTAYHYNESLGWRTSKGQMVVNRESWLKRLPPKSATQLQPAHGAMFADIIRRLQCPEAALLINSFRGLSESNGLVSIVFATMNAVEVLSHLCQSNQPAVETIIALLRRLYPNISRFRITK